MRYMNCKYYLNTDNTDYLLALVPPLYDIWFISMKPHMAPCWAKGSLSLKKKTPGTWTPLIKSFATPCGTDSSAEVTYASWGSRYPQGKDHSSGKSSVTETLDSRTERRNQAWVHSTSPRGPLEAFWLPMPANLNPKYPTKKMVLTLGYKIRVSQVLNKMGTPCSPVLMPTDHHRKTWKQ